MHGPHRPDPERKDWSRRRARKAARLARAPGQPAPILLLDEVAAHLDRRRRTALFEEIEALALQAFLTGTDEHLFEGLAGRAQGVRVEGSGLVELG